MQEKKKLKKIYCDTHRCLQTLNLLEVLICVYERRFDILTILKLSQELTVSSSCPPRVKSSVRF